jgi:hypothetical protein
VGVYFSEPQTTRKQRSRPSRIPYASRNKSCIRLSVRRVGGEGQEQMKFPLRKDVPWRPEDDALLRELARAGEQVAKIAKHLNRSEGSTRNRALRLNIALAKARRLKDLTGK